MVLVRRTLSKYCYPPAKQQQGIDTVLKQAEVGRFRCSGLNNLIRQLLGVARTLGSSGSG